MLPERVYLWWETLKTLYIWFSLKYIGPEVICTFKSDTATSLELYGTETSEASVINTIWIFLKRF